MKTYPSIVSAGRKPPNESLYTFAKLDGSNLRFEWHRKRGWNKFGTRTRLFDHTDPIFGCAIDLFLNKYSDELEKIFKKQNYEEATSFCEFCGENSFAGKHVLDETKNVTLFDVDVFKKCIIGPRQFLDLFGHLDHAAYLGKHIWDQEFIEAVYNKEIDGITLEGVIGKTGESHQLKMYKAKTKEWLDLIRARYSEEEANQLINS
jgi:hypothetical protein